MKAPSYIYYGTKELFCVRKYRTHIRDRVKEKALSYKKEKAHFFRLKDQLSIKRPFFKIPIRGTWY